MTRRALVVLVIVLSIPLGASAGDGTLAGAGYAAGAPQRIRLPWVESAQGDTVFLRLQRFEDQGSRGAGVRYGQVEIVGHEPTEHVALDLNVADGPAGVFGTEAVLPASLFPADPALLGGAFAFTVPNQADGEPVDIALTVTPTGPPAFEMEEFHPRAAPIGGGLDFILTWRRPAVADVEIVFGDVRVTVKAAPIEFSREQWFFSGAGIAP